MGSSNARPITLGYLAMFICAFAQESRSPYEQALDKWFPVDSTRSIFTLNILILPAFDPESQVTLRLDREGGRAKEWRANKNIGYAPQGGAAPKVECRNVGVAPAQLIIWHRRVMTEIGRAHV